MIAQEFERIRDQVLRQPRDAVGLSQEVVSMRKKCVTRTLTAANYLTSSMMLAA
jgi:glutamine synthetase adenylyltransferase